MSRLRLVVAARCGAVLTVLVAAMLGGCGDNLTVADDAGVPPQADAATAEAGGPWRGVVAIGPGAAAHDLVVAKVQDHAYWWVDFLAE